MNLFIKLENVGTKPLKINNKLQIFYKNYIIPRKILKKQNNSFSLADASQKSAAVLAAEKSFFAARVANCPRFCYNRLELNLESTPCKRSY